MLIEQLDNPVWAALTSGNVNLAIGNDKARYYAPGVSAFAAVAENNFAHFKALMDLKPWGETIAVFTTDKNLNAHPWTIVNRIDGYQMMYDGATPEEQRQITITKLSEEDVPAMLELTKLSPPGPFMEKTIRFGGYEGIFEDKQLVAMAGHRFHCGPYVEISAVCTHPVHTGKGFARALINSHIRQLRAAGKMPYLHVRADNTRAINLYQAMGFVIRTEMIIYVLTGSDVI
ncbi:GNAT family N-acetyltransferase [Mucilaginibacter sp. PAMB04274]|uniref:GNAT family N-acetyltransferase n=1 Tax=Mucilaginibacter sp. PAMB04274 TaxID=3138568 RepID=UPI0031F6517B